MKDRELSRKAIKLKLLGSNLTSLRKDYLKLFNSGLTEAMINNKIVLINRIFQFRPNNLTLLYQHPTHQMNNSKNHYAKIRFRLNSWYCKAEVKVKQAQLTVMKISSYWRLSHLENVLLITQDSLWINKLQWTSYRMTLRRLIIFMWKESTYRVRFTGRMVMSWRIQTINHKTGTNCWKITRKIRVILEKRLSIQTKMMKNLMMMKKIYWLVVFNSESTFLLTIASNLSIHE